jgi:hypothetical protein
VYGQVCSAKSSAQLAPETGKQLDGNGGRILRKRRELSVADHVANNIIVGDDSSGARSSV